MKKRATSTVHGSVVGVTLADTEHGGKTLPQLTDLFILISSNSLNLFGFLFFANNGVNSQREETKISAPFWIDWKVTFEKKKKK